MKPNLKFETSEGHQISVFPSPAVVITQNPLSEFSHKGAKSTDNSYDTDIKLYAPVDLKCVLNNGHIGGGLTYYHTVEKVLTPTGLRHYTLAFAHDDNATQWQVGKIYPQGSHIYSEGTAGYVTGRHVHIDVASGHVTQQIQNEHGVWDLLSSVYLDEIMFINHTLIIQPNAPTTNHYTFNWQEYEDGLIIKPKPKQDELLHLMLSKAFPFNF